VRTLFNLVRKTYERPVLDKELQDDIADVVAQIVSAPGSSESVREVQPSACSFP